MLVETLYDVEVSPVGFDHHAILIIPVEFPSGFRVPAGGSS